ncbi:hypothetical protein [Enterococcus durans]|uniref:hypothetical protein n=1 Tax=Enterococcus durans TaxID=53345 RepID=UPI0021AF9746|nr:hypothetical protein [Enterococcus durans]
MTKLSLNVMYKDLEENHISYLFQDYALLENQTVQYNFDLAKKFNHTISNDYILKEEHLSVFICIVIPKMTQDKKQVIKTTIIDKNGNELKPIIEISGERGK